jgi:hypothetical protein
MIERYTLKFTPAVSQKELEKVLHEEGVAGQLAIQSQLYKMWTRIEIIGGFEDLKQVSEALKKLSGPRSYGFDSSGFATNITSNPTSSAR